MYVQEKGAKMRRIEEKKQWDKPVFTTIDATDLKNHIKASARSQGGSCDSLGK